MQGYDNTLKYLSDKLPHHYVDLVFEECKGDIALLDRELPSTKRESDCLIKVSDTTKHTEFILHLEFQSSYDANMPHRMLSYYTRILDKYELPIYPVVIYLYPNRPGLDIIYHAKNKSQLDKLIDLAISSNNLSEFEKNIQNT